MPDLTQRARGALDRSGAGDLRREKMVFLFTVKLSSVLTLSKMFVSKFTPVYFGQMKETF